MNQRGFVPLFLLLILFGLVLAGGLVYYLLPHKNPEVRPLPLATVSPTALPVSINEGQIGLIEGNNVYLYETSTKKRQQLQIPNLSSPSNLTFSRDGSFLFVDSPDGVVAYNLLTNQALNIKVDGPGPRVAFSTDISSNNKYFIVTESCCPGDAGRTLVTIDGKIIKQLVGGSIAWSTDNTQFAISKGEVTLQLDLAPMPANSSVYAEQIQGDIVTEKLLIKATNQASYLPIKWVDDHTLLIKKVAYSQPFPDHLDGNDQKANDYWLKVYENSTTSSFMLDTITHKITTIMDYKEEPFEWTSYSPDHNWKVFVEGGSTVGPTFISKIDGTSKEKISDKAFPFWRP